MQSITWFLTNIDYLQDNLTL